MEKVSDDLISVIVPVYNIEKDIKYCVDSIINQTYENIEIILIDDGSTDNSGKICDKLRENNHKIRVVHKRNGGLSDARNAGIEISKGKYITFVDGDDYIEKDYCKILYDVISKFNADLAIGSHKVYYKDSKSVIYKNSNLYNIFEKEEVFRRILYDDGIDLSACFKLYSRKLFEEVRFPVGRLYEDAATTYKLINKAKIIGVDTRKSIYTYMIRENSISTSTFSKRKLDLIISTEEMTNFIKSKYPELNDACDRRLMYAYLSTLVQYAKANGNDKDIKNKLISYINENSTNYLSNNNIPKRDKIAIITLKFGYPFFKFSWNIYSKLSGRSK